MRDAELDLRSTNWQQGMLLAPEHFLQQERYFESYVRWISQYCMRGAGLIGSGLRSASLSAAAAYDPIINHRQDDHQIRIVVTQVRAISEQGRIFEVTQDNPAEGIFPTDQFLAQNEIDVYVIPDDKKEFGQERDEFNPNMVPHRVQGYRVAVNLDEGSLSDRILVGRLVRTERGQRFEILGQFIPPCVTVSAHSQMKLAWDGILRQLRAIAEMLVQMHKSMVEYMELLQDRNIKLSEDRATLEFVGRMVVAIEDCMHASLDPAISPERFLQELFRLVRNSAVFLKVSPPTQEYFKMLVGAGRTEFMPLLDAQLETLLADRMWHAESDLASEVQQIKDGIDRLDKLIEGIGAKYLDYRVNPSLARLPFVILRETEQLLVVVATASHSQIAPTKDGRRERTIIFGRVKLESRKNFSVILMGDERSAFSVGDTIRVKLYVNVATGFETPPIDATAICQIAGQKNFHVTFKVESVGEVADVRLSFLEDAPISTAMLYVPMHIVEQVARRDIPIPQPFSSTQTATATPGPTPANGNQNNQSSPNNQKPPERPIGGSRLPPNRLPPGGTRR